MKKTLPVTLQQMNGIATTKALVLLFLFAGMMSIAGAQSPDADALTGRWDITFDMDGREVPGWLEISKSGTQTLVGQIVVGWGSARPVSQVHLSDNKLHFSIPVQWESGHDLGFEATLNADRLSGTMLYANGKRHLWTAVRAPSLRRDGEPRWGTPVLLFNGTDLTGWTTQHATDQNQWTVEDGILLSPRSGANLRTVDTYDDFKLHIEFRYPQSGNSGVYLRGRYEVQIEDNMGQEPNRHLFGGIYGFLSPSEMAAKAPGEWQTFDITLSGRMVTVVANGITVVCNREIPGITGGAIDSSEGEPGPILLQGDHGPVEFRSILLVPGL